MIWRFLKEYFFFLSGGVVLRDLEIIETGIHDHMAGAVVVLKLTAMWKCVAEIQMINVEFPFIVLPCVQV